VAVVVLVTLCFVLCGQACSSNPEDPKPPSATLLNGQSDPSDFVTPDDVDVDLYLDNKSLDVLTIQESAHQPRNRIPGDAALLFWEFEDTPGHVIATGAMVDPRLSTTEFDANGVANPINGAPMSSALFSVTLPNIGGTFRLYDAPPGAQGLHTQSLWGGVQIAFAYIKKIAQRFWSKIFPPGQTHKPNDTGSVGVQTEKKATACGTFSLLVVGDGYTKNEQQKFHADVKAALSSIAAIPKYSDHWNAFNVYTMEMVSQDSGITDPGLTDPNNAANNKPAVTRNTALGVSFGTGDGRRCTVPRPGIPAAAATQLAQGKTVSNADVTVIIANTSEYAGCAIPSQSLITQSANSDASRVLAHELGHALFKLADEYEYGTCSNTDGINVASNLNALPWQQMVNTTQIPTTSGGSDTVGAFEGANYCKTGEWRPSPTCLMKELASPFCPVCACQFDKTVISRQQSQGCGTVDKLPDMCNPPKDAGPDADASNDAGDGDAGGGKKTEFVGYDSCKGRADGVYCSQLSDYGAIVCKSESIAYGVQCPSPQKCTGPNGPGSSLQCNGQSVGGGGDAGGGGDGGGPPPNPDSCGSRADGIYCSTLTPTSALLCKGGSIAGGYQCPTNQTCKGPNGPGTAIVCQ
jgi:hypothetical protein